MSPYKDTILLNDLKQGNQCSETQKTRFNKVYVNGTIASQ